jgi:hypothetical protein
VAKVKPPSKEEKEFHFFCMSLGCCVPWCNREPVVFHHQKQAYPKPRRSHKWGVNICDHHHREFHDVYGSDEAFFDEYDVWLPDVAEENYELYWKDNYAGDS